MGEAARAGGRLGYLRAAAGVLRFSPIFRVALFAQRAVGTRRLLSSALAYRFEKLMVRRIVLGELTPFVANRIAPVMGQRVAGVCRQILRRRRERLEEALGALSLQYPHYAAALEARFLERIALSRERHEYAMLREEGIIGAELMGALDRELAASNRRLERSLALDLAVDKSALLRQIAIFSELDEAALSDIARRLKVRFVVPGERLIQRGERGDTVYLVASGAVEVDVGSGDRIQLGRGAVVGELAALSGDRRSADVTMLGYGELLILDGRGFRDVVAVHPAVRAAVDALVETRLERSDARAEAAE